MNKVQRVIRAWGIRTIVRARIFHQLVPCLHQPGKLTIHVVHVLKGSPISPSNLLGTEVGLLRVFGIIDKMNRGFVLLLHGNGQRFWMCALESDIALIIDIHRHIATLLRRF